MVRAPRRGIEQLVFADRVFELGGGVAGSEGIFAQQYRAGRSRAYRVPAD